MVLTFDDIIYQQTFTVKKKDDSFDVVVTVTDKESELIGESINAALRGEISTDDELLKLLFKDNYDKIKDELFGVNLTRFVFAVMGDYANFIMLSLREVRGTTMESETVER